MMFELPHALAERMKQTPQSERWHGEGDVLAHTGMVVDELHALPDYKALPRRQQELLTVAAWLHDIGKITQSRQVGDHIEAPNHAGVGSRMAREMLWRESLLCGTADSMSTREAISLLIRYHSFPPHAIDSPDAKVRLHRIAANGLLAPDFSVKLLCILAKADMKGRICDDKAEMLDQIALCEELAREEGCYEAPYAFPSELTRRAYLNGRDLWKEQLLHDDTWGEVVLMSGLPGTGKDTWISRNMPDNPMVSLDEIRRIHKIAPTSPQGFVANVAKEQAKEFLRRHQPFVWNATNLTADTRRKLISLFESYKARVRIVYLETDWQTQLLRNASRPDPVPLPVITSMLSKLTLPEAHEAAGVEWLTV